MLLLACLRPQRALEREKARHADLVNALRGEANKGLQEVVQVSAWLAAASTHAPG